ncbi:hypothetical protein RRG08_030954 [Elysia crispata]|uniref:Uncharacterized protein n=1 Tax=Elysia crispata TaxID=231223 RepID=A0AAE1AA77_9GAST|nr:hypothetical protein RRG08_030954 [Elysia crispata]
MRSFYMKNSTDYLSRMMNQKSFNISDLITSKAPCPKFLSWLCSSAGRGRLDMGRQSSHAVKPIKLSRECTPIKKGKQETETVETTVRSLVSRGWELEIYLTLQSRAVTSWCQTVGRAGPQ